MKVSDLVRAIFLASTCSKTFVYAVVAIVLVKYEESLHILNKNQDDEKNSAVRMATKECQIK